MTFTICIPTFNRKNLLKRNLSHLELLNFEKKKFEVIVVDDGSTDGTDVMLESFLNESDLDLKYFKKENGGKYSAVNYAISVAKGFFFINCDSDDYLDKDCLLNIFNLWEKIEISKKGEIAGIIGQNLNMNTNKIIGSSLPKDILYSDPIEMRFRYRIKGDKFTCFILDILKTYRFPDVNGLTFFIPESYLYYGISSKYKFYYSNTVFKICEYQIDGITSNIQRYRIQNAFGCYLTYKKYVELYGPSKSFYGYVRNYINYVRFAIHTNNKLIIKNFLDIFFIPLALIYFIKDKRLNK